MDDNWPNYNDLTLDGFHWIWKFHQDYSEPDLVHLLLESPQTSHREVVLHVDCVPQLACFDLEYWDAMTMNVKPDDEVEELRMRMRQKYLQNVRTRITSTLSEAERGTLLQRSLLMQIAHKWSIRTVNKYTHSPFGRNKYETRCLAEGLVPYQQILTPEGEGSLCSNVAINLSPGISFQTGKNTSTRTRRSTPRQRIKATWHT